VRLRNPHDREIARLAFPAFIALIAEPLYLLTDTAVVGHLGTPELGGLAVAAILLATGASLFVFLAYGTTSGVARLVGAGAHERAAHEGVQALWLAAGIAVVLACLGALFAAPLVEALGAEGEIRLHALTYFRISLIGLPALLVSMAGTGYLRGLQDTRTPLAVTIGANVLNLVLEVVLIFGLGYGVGASAFATVFAQTCGAAVYVWFVARGARRTGTSVRPDPVVLRALSRLGFDLFLRTVSLRGVLLASTAVAARIGTTELAANQVVLEIWNFLAFMLDAIAIAGQAIIGQTLGAGRGEEARAVGRRMIEWGVASGVVLGVLMIALRSVIAPIFSGDEAVVRVIANTLIFAALFQPIAGIAFVLDGVLIGAGDQRHLAWAMFLAALVFVPGAVAVVAFDLGLAALWWAIGGFMTARAVTLLVRFAGPQWQVLGVKGT
jgi:putative MATE family efflux protein